MRHFLVVFTVLSLVALSSCRFGGKRVRGDGNVTTQNRSVGNFSGVDVSGAIDVYLTQDSSYSVKVEVDNNLQEFIEVYVDGNKLRIHQRNNTSLDPTRDIKVYVSAPSYRRVEASGACSVISKNRLGTDDDFAIHLSGACDVDLDLKAPRVRAEVSGACSVTLKGETKDFSVDGSGSTDLKCFGLLTENADVDLSGASDAEVYASVKLDASASGSTDIKYKGNPSVNSHMSGASSIKKAD